MKTIMFFLGIILFNLNGILAQDTIVKRDNARIICKIKEILVDEIKYQPKDNNIIVGIDKNEVLKVILSTGVVMNFQNTMTDKESYKDQKKNAIKFRLLSPLYQYSDFTYERSLKPGSSIECSIGIIGLGEHYGDKLNGISLRLGYKFIKSPNFYLKGIRYAHLLKGMYFRPEIATSFYTKNSNNIFATAVLFNIGNQWIFNDMFLVDLYLGLGYGYSSEDSFNIQYGYSTGASSFPLAISSGFRLGFLIK
ncbi:MAG: hypothetical protein Q8928_15985 [Bacteroidota bacterium]|nr:hypothetical protein [Bacteroidota bacterium]